MTRENLLPALGVVDQQGSDKSNEIVSYVQEFAAGKNRRVSQILLTRWQNCKLEKATHQLISLRLARKHTIRSSQMLRSSCTAEKYCYSEGDCIAGSSKVEETESSYG